VIKVTVTKKNQFPINNLSLLWPIDTKLAVWVAYIKTQLVIATQASVIKWLMKQKIKQNKYCKSRELNNYYIWQFLILTGVGFTAKIWLKCKMLKIILT